VLGHGDLGKFALAVERDAAARRAADSITNTRHAGHDRSGGGRRFTRMH
jgi:hypothetical protein